MLISGNEVEPSIEKFIEICTSIGKLPNLTLAASAMKVCMVQLAHKTRANFQMKRYQHKLIVLIYLEGTLEQTDLMQWYLHPLMSNVPWQFKVVLRH